MTQQTIDIANAEIPIPGPVIAAARKILGQLPYDNVEQLPAQIDAALQRWAAEQSQDIADAEALAEDIDLA